MYPYSWCMKVPVRSSRSRSTAVKLDDGVLVDGVRRDEYLGAVEVNTDDPIRDCPPHRRGHRRPDIPALNAEALISQRGHQRAPRGGDPLDVPRRARGARFDPVSVGANGAGKSTLLRILARDLEPLDGAVSVAPADAFVGWLPQEHERVPGETVAAYIARRAGCTDATQAMEEAAAALADPGSETSKIDPAVAYSAALDHWLATGAADLDDRLPAVLADLGWTLTRCVPSRRR